MSRKGNINRKDRFGPRAKSRKEESLDKRTFLLIVMNGEQTEKKYFSEFKKRADQGSVILKVRKGDPTKVLAKAQEEASLSKVPYDEVWLVFDKDHYQSLSSVVSEAKKLSPKKAKSPSSETETRFEVGWINNSFELWFLLHFKDVGSSPIEQKTCERELQKFLRKKTGNPNFKYEKNGNHYKLLEQHGVEGEAINRANKLLREAKKKRPDAPWEVNPSTRIHELVKKLRKLESK
jgi:hypothetical protein